MKRFEKGKTLIEMAVTQLPYPQLPTAVVVAHLETMQVNLLRMAGSISNYTPV